MTYLEVFNWGMQHIASNHGFSFGGSLGVGDSVCIYGGCNVPTVADVRMLCDDLSIPRDCIESSEFGVDVYYDGEWLGEKADKVYVPTGMEMWKRSEATIGN